MLEENYVEVLPHVLNSHPRCPHGPTLLFSRDTKRGVRKFYACSACRDRKLCHFFLWSDETHSDEGRRMWESERKKFIGAKSHEEMFATFRMLKTYSSKKGSYCHTCNELVLQDYLKQHTDHDLTVNLSQKQLARPTELLKPLNCDKKEAQYLFSEASLKTLMNVAFMNKIKSVICMGAPRVHEYINTCELNMRSMLLDFDKRYHMFYGPEEFCWFNSFNCHFFFGQTSKNAFEKFILHSEGGLLLVLDPPFGGMLEPLSHTLKYIEMLCKELNPHLNGELPVLLINPYFMEQQVISYFPSFNMIDYKITYNNHPLFSQDSKSSKGSPVRIFTNINPKKVILPESEGYKFCTICECWVSKNNQHCRFCNKCTSKNGSSYEHCKICQKCVKPSWKHCDKCKRCCLKIHQCTPLKSSVKCFLCGKEGHKKNSCVNLPNTNSLSVINILNCSQKRKGETLQRKIKRKKMRNL